MPCVLLQIYLPSPCRRPTVRKLKNYWEVILGGEKPYRLYNVEEYHDTQRHLTVEIDIVLFFHFCCMLKKVLL